jgi:predicted RNA-binding Zn ribbon-like protein
MTSHEFGGVRLPDAVAGHPALDFCNTRAGWGEAAPKEYLHDAESLLLWCLEQELLRDDTVDRLRERVQEDDAAAAVMLRAALELREAVHDVALGTRDGEPWDVVAGWARRGRAAARLVPYVAEAADVELARVEAEASEGDVPARWELDEPAADVEAPLLAIARSVEDLLTSSLGTTVGACPGSGCGWLFTDRRRRRRWCSMAACGNREKARRHAERARRSAA